jgi:hypothetical protein
VEWDNEVLVIDTTGSKEIGIGSHGRKNDRIDAETMARAVERGGIPLAHVLSPHRRQLRRWLGIRRSLVEARANLVTTLRGLAREQGLRLPSSPSENFAKNFRNGKHPAELSALLEAGVKTLEVITAELDAVPGEVSRSLSPGGWGAEYTFQPARPLIVARLIACTGTSRGGMSRVSRWCPRSR